jgi:hypothetical protein
MPHARLITPLLSCLAVSLGLFGCASGQIVPLPGLAAPAPSSSQRSSLRLRIVVPPPARAVRNPRYISPATRYIAIRILNAKDEQVASASQNLTPGSPGCTPTGGRPVTCTIEIGLAPAKYSADVVTYDRHGGNVLSEANGYPFTIVRGTDNAISMVLDGVPTSVQVLPEASAVFLGGDQNAGFQFAGLVPQMVDVFGRDADGNVILGPGAPLVGLTSGSHDLVVTPAGNVNPNRFVLTRKALTGAAIALTASATRAGSDSTVSVAPHLRFVSLIYLYEKGGIGEYAPWSDVPVLTISDGLSKAMTFNTSAQQNQLLALDPEGNLFAVDTPKNAVVVYAPGSTTPARTITSGLSQPIAVTTDAAGDLYAANENDVTVYGPGRTTVGYTITSGIANPTALAFDGSQTLYVCDLTTDSVTEYAYGSTSLLRTVSAGIFLPYGIGLDASNTLYVGSAGNIGSSNIVTSYAAGTTTVANTLTVGPSTVGTAKFLGGLAVNGAGIVCVAVPDSVNCGDEINGFVSTIGGFPIANDFSPAMEFDSTGALYVLGMQPDTDMLRAYAPLGSQLVTSPTPLSVINGNTQVFGIAVQR